MTSTEDIKEANTQCLASMRASRDNPTHYEFIVYILNTCKEAAAHFRNDTACFRVPDHLDGATIVDQLKEGGFMCYFTRTGPDKGMLKVGWYYDGRREPRERKSNDESPVNINKVQLLKDCIQGAVEHMGLSSVRVRFHPTIPRSALATFSWAP